MVLTPLPKNVGQSLSNQGQGEQSFPMPLFDYNYSRKLSGASFSDTSYTPLGGINILK